MLEWLGSRYFRGFHCMPPIENEYGNGTSLFLTGDTSLNRWFSIVILVFRGVNSSAVEKMHCLCMSSWCVNDP